MNRDVIIESGMEFRKPEVERFFYLEKSSLFKQFGERIRSVEFIALFGNRLDFVEAKTTCPNVNNKETSAEKKRKYEEYYDDLTRKFRDSINILSASLLGKYEKVEEIGTRIRELDQLLNIKIRFVLVIKNADEIWLGGVKAELEERLFTIRKIWQADIIVYNEDMAKKKSFVN